MPVEVLTIGEILVEIMAVTPGQGFREAIDLVGPFPSGAPAIFIDQVAKQGHECAIIGCVGNDDFGWLNIERLKADGVNVSGIEVVDDAVTGSAFVRYRPDGQRDFVFNIKHSATGTLHLTEAGSSIIARARHLHVVGSSLVSQPIVDLVRHALDRIKSTGGTVSFDPNIRKEMLDLPGLRAALAMVLEKTDLFLPSDEEIELFTERDNQGLAMEDLLARGISAIVQKQGSKGAGYRDHASDIVLPAFQVAEIDPTGAGDIFAATFVCGWLRCLPPAECLRRANAAGALAVCRKGPMEGTSGEAEIDRFLQLK